MPAAVSLADELYNELGIKAKLIQERDGVFDVFVDGYLIFSMSEANRFPEPGEIVAMFNQ